MFQVILFNVTNGLIIGAFYVLMALGLSLILNLSNVINFAHGNFLALGGYLAFMLVPTFGYWGALLIAPLLTAVIGMVVELAMIRWVYKRDPVYSLLLTFGLAFVMQDLARWYWGPNPLQIDMPDVLKTPLSSDLFFITWYRIFMVAIVVATVVGLFAFLRRTRVGLRIRAGTLDLDTVAALGVNVRLLRTINFAVGCLLAGLSGRAQRHHPGRGVPRLGKEARGKRNAQLPVERDPHRRTAAEPRQAAGQLRVVGNDGAGADQDRVVRRAQQMGALARRKPGDPAAFA